MGRVVAPSLARKLTAWTLAWSAVACTVPREGLPPPWLDPDAAADEEPDVPWDPFDVAWDFPPKPPDAATDGAANGKADGKAPWSQPDGAASDVATEPPWATWPYCKDDHDCAEHLGHPHCWKWGAKCVPCQFDLDCPTGDKCLSFQCKPPPMPCDDPEVHTYCDQDAVVLCLPDGQTEVVHTCPTGVCDQGHCALCVPGVRCAKNQPGGWSLAIEACTASGPELTPCPTGSHCIQPAANLPYCAVCTPGERSCLGKTIALCASDGQSWLPEVDCQESGHTCVLGMCK